MVSSIFAFPAGNYGEERILTTGAPLGERRGQLRTRGVGPTPLSVRRPAAAGSDQVYQEDAALE